MNVQTKGEGTHSCEKIPHSGGNARITVALNRHEVVVLSLAMHVSA